jgi:hypothetical protein
MNFNLFSPKYADWKQTAMNLRFSRADVGRGSTLCSYLRISWSILLAGKRSIQQEASCGPATTGGGVDMREVEIMLTSDSEVACPSTYRRRLVGHPEGCAAAACWHFFLRSNHGIPIMSWMREMDEMTPSTIALL